MRSRWIFRFLPLWLLAVLCPVAAEALVYTYDNTTSGAVPFVASDAGCVGTNLSVNFTVADSFTVSSIALALNVSHTTRGDLRGVLVAPGGTTFTALAQDLADDNDNYDVQLSTNGGARNDGDIDPTAAPFFNRRVAVAGINFYTGNSAGTWTLRLCDRDNNGVNGTFNRARLVLSSATAATSVCTSTATFDWGSNGNVVAFTNQTVNGITVTQGTITDLGGTGASASGVLGNAVVTRTTTNGNHAGYYGLSMDASALGGTQDSEAVGLISVLTFSPAVQNLTFTFLDVDITGGAWEDQVQIIGTGPSGARTPYTITPVAGATVAVAGDLAEGNSSAANTATTGNLTVVFSGAVSSLTINYTQGADPTTENAFMVVGISDLTYCAMDYGDAPNTYGTALAGGARHVVGDRTLYLGTNPPDGESDGAPGAAATTDDTTQVGGVDDEDGVASFPDYAGGSANYTVSVTAVNLSTTTAATLVGYIDWNRDGDFADANEVSGSVNVPASTNSPTAFNVTWSSVPSNGGGSTSSYARFRISYTAAEVTSPTGLATSGEVEDYPIPVDTLPVTLASFEAQPRLGGQLAVRWTTATETATVGYRVMGWDGKGWVPLHAKWVPSKSIDSLAPQEYEMVVDAAGFSWLGLEDVDIQGTTTVAGPFAVGVAHGRDELPAPIDWAAIRAESATLSGRSPRVVRRGHIQGLVEDGTVLAELLVTREGMQQVRFEDLLAAGINLTGFPRERLSLTVARTDQMVPLGLPVGAVGAFGPGDVLEFRGLPAGNSLYTRTRVYRLIAASAGTAARMKVRDGQPLGAPVTTYTATQTTDRAAFYSFASPTGDPWYEAAVLAQGGAAERSFPFTADALVASSGRLAVRLWGVTNWPGEAPDHHVTLAVNGQTLADVRFDGLVTRDFDLKLPEGLLVEGENQLTVTLPGDTGYAFDLVHLDRYTLSHPRRLVATGGRLTFPLANATAEVSGLGSPDVAVFTRQGGFRLSGVVVTPDGAGYRARFQVPALAAGAGSGALVVDVVEAAAFLRPGVRAPRPPVELFDTPAEYLVITHADFAASLGGLIAAREAQGLRVKKVDVADLYAAYSGGEPDPEAIRTYLVSAASRLGVRMVLLVGGDTYDYLDDTGVGSVSFVPTLYAQTDDIVRYAPADALLGDLDRDGVPEIAVGRLPARTPAELAQLIAKTLQFSHTPPGAVLAADLSTTRTFSEISETTTTRLPPGWPAVRAYVDDLGLASARQELLAGFSAGARWISFVGHSGPTAWTFQGLFSTDDIAALGNGNAPSAVVQWGCWNTYHVAPAYDTLAHRLLLAGPQGAALVVGSSTLSKASSDARLGPALVDAMFKPGATAGEALVAAKRAVAAGGGDVRDVLVGWTLLGDPALVMQPETP